MKYSFDRSEPCLAASGLTFGRFCAAGLCSAAGGLSALGLLLSVRTTLRNGASKISSSGTRGARIDGGALPEGFLPPGLESRRQFLAHLLRGVGVQAAHSRDLVSKPLLGQDLGSTFMLRYESSFGGAGGNGR